MMNKIMTFILIFFFGIIMSQNRYIDKVFDSTSVKTLNYSIRGKDTLKLDVYEPVNDTLKQRPLFVIVHGGGFNSGKRNTNSLINLAENITKKGYVVTSIDYRLLNKSESFSCDLSIKQAMKIYQNAAADLLNALLYLDTYKNDFRIDDSKIILFGLSAGAETALNVVYNRDLIIKNNKKFKAIQPSGVITISGAVFNADLINNENAIPSVLYHGVDDKIVPYGKGAHHSCNSKSKGYLQIEGSKNIAKKLEANNSSFMLYSYLNKGHDIFNLPNEDFYQAFLFIKKVIIENKFFQAKITEN